jgi:hypothetical protein
VSPAAVNTYVGVLGTVLSAYLDNQPIYLVNCITELVVGILPNNFSHVLLWDVKLVADNAVADRRASGSKCDDTSLEQLDAIQYQTVDNGKLSLRYQRW